MILKNKKADVNLPMEEVIKIILAVIGIVALIYLAVSFYGIFQSKTRIEQARANLDEIVSRMDGLKEGQSFDYMLLSPKGFSLIGWPLSSAKEKILPKQCTDKLWKNCICMCRYAGTYTAKEDQYYLGWFAKASSGLGGVVAIMDWIEIARMDTKVMAACDTEGVCREAKGAITVVGIMPQLGWDTLKNSLASAGASGIGKALELTVLIRVDELIDKKKQLNLSLTNGGYKIIPND